MHKEILSKEQLQLLPLLKAFSNYYNEKLFREQLSYFEDLDHSEEIRYQGIELQDDEIKKYLQDIATEEF